MEENLVTPVTDEDPHAQRRQVSGSGGPAGALFLLELPRYLRGPFSVLTHTALHCIFPLPNSSLTSALPLRNPLLTPSTREIPHLGLEFHLDPRDFFPAQQVLYDRPT